MDILEVSCKDNPDLNGKWHKNDVMLEMEELGIEDNWIDYILGHLFTDCDQAIIDAVSSGKVNAIECMADGSLVKMRLS